MTSRSKRVQVVDEPRPIRQHHTVGPRHSPSPSNTLTGTNLWNLENSPGPTGGKVASELGRFPHGTPTPVVPANHRRKAPFHIAYRIVRTHTPRTESGSEGRAPWSGEFGNDPLNEVV